MWTSGSSAAGALPGGESQRRERDEDDGAAHGTRVAGQPGTPPTIAGVDTRAVGVFDSGMGGLTVLHECLVTMPHEDFVYLGDAARLPYGPRPLPEVRQYAREIARYLQARDVKLVLVACNSATAAALPELQEELSVPVVG